MSYVRSPDLYRDKSCGGKDVDDVTVWPSCGSAGIAALILCFSVVERRENGM